MSSDAASANKKLMGSTGKKRDGYYGNRLMRTVKPGIKIYRKYPWQIVAFFTGFSTKITCLRGCQTCSGAVFAFR